MTVPGTADQFRRLQTASAPTGDTLPPSSDVALVHVCRHGLVDNPGNVLYSRLPGFHLSESGRAMAETLGDYFADVPVAHLRTSPLERAQETMAPIAARHPDVPVVVDWRLIEADSRMQGQVKGPASLGLARPSNWRLYLTPAGWGEPYDHMARRLLEAIADAGVTVGPAGQAVIVSHQAPIWAARRMAEHKFLFNIPAIRQCALASVTTFSVGPDGTVRFVAYDDVIGSATAA